MSEERTDGAVAENLPVLDLSGFRERGALPYRRITNVAVVLVPEDAPDLLAGVHCQNVAAVVPVPAGKGMRVERRIGQQTLSGDSLAAGGEDTILLVVGQVIVTPPAAAVGYRGLALVGQVILPKSMEPMIAGKVIVEVGQRVYYDDRGENLRIVQAATRFSRAYFDLVEEPETLVLIGDSTFAADVTPEILRAKVRGLVLIGDATVENADLRPLIEYMARDRVGDITVAGESEES